MYEIDKKIKLLEGVNRGLVNYGDFLTKNITKKYQTIVGNPPYVKTKSGNLYIDFITKCFDLLDMNGELIFIVPSDFLKLTSTVTILSNMIANGTFTHIFHPHNEKLFDNASIDVIVFRYCKNDTLAKQVLYNNVPLYIVNSNGLITFKKNKPELQVTFQDYFDVYVGLVSGKEEIYKNDELGNLEILNGENKVDKYIYINEYPSEFAEIDEYLLQHKDELMARKIRKFNENNWFEWGAPRNISAINRSLGSRCLYINKAQ